VRPEASPSSPGPASLADELIAAGAVPDASGGVELNDHAACLVLRFGDIVDARLAAEEAGDHKLYYRANLLVDHFQRVVLKDEGLTVEVNVAGAIPCSLEEAREIVERETAEVGRETSERADREAALQGRETQEKQACGSRRPEYRIGMR
jgi:hypothetical protein